jgi:DNA (cytosine-5)-methyltransferase 1
MDVGVEFAGWDVRWQVENDPFCNAILERRWPSVTRYKDVRHKFYPETVDLVFGGFPCQPVSSAGLRLGEADHRWLWPSMLKLVRRLQPKWVMIENVSGLRTRGLGAVLKGLADSGYDAEWDCLPAAAFGAPHLRYRYFIVAYPCSESEGRQGSRVFSERWRGCTFAEGANVANSNSQQYEGFSHALNGSRGTYVHSYPNSARFQRLGDQRKLCQVESEVAVGRFGWWKSEPDVGRVAYGVPSRVDRLRGLGNAVVPQVAYWVASRIMEAELANAE